MTNLDDVADRLHRTVKLAIDTGEAATVEEAERIFAGYRLQFLSVLKWPTVSFFRRQS